MALRHRRKPHLCASWLIASSALLSGGCGGGPTHLRIESDHAVIEPLSTTAIYVSVDTNTADIYLSDLDPDVLAERLRRGTSGVPFSLLHVHLFIHPKAGRTPIDFSATSASVRHIVFTGESMGVYGGGGFLLPSDDIGDAEFSGRIKEASLKMIQSTPGFEDRLGLATLSGRISALRDDEAARRVGEALGLLLARAERVER